MRIPLVLVALSLLVGVAVLTKFVTAGSLAGMGMALLLQRARKRPYSRGAGWLGAVTGAGLAIFGALVFVVARAPSDTLDSMRREAARQRQEDRARLPEVLRRFERSTPAAPVIQAKTDSLLASRGGFWFTVVFGGVMIAVFGGAIAGSAVWAAVTLMTFTFSGRWPPSGAASTLRPYRGDFG